MNLIYALEQSGQIHRVGWGLVHSLWLGMAIAAVLAWALWCLRGRSANARYFACCGAMVVLLAATVGAMVLVEPPARAAATPAVGATPVAVAMPAASPGPRVDAPSGMGVAAPPLAPVNAGSVPAVAAPSVVAPWSARVGRLIEPYLPWVVLTWAGGVLAMALWQLWGWMGAMRIRRMARVASEAGIVRIVARLAHALRISQPVTVLDSMIVGVPTVIGWLRPVILLPAGLATGLSTEQLEAILLHELAHIRRMDYLVNLLQRLVEAILFYHPAVWFISRRIRVERENCCDDVTLAAGGEPTVYAEALLAVAAPRAPRMAMAANGGKLLPRIRRILGLSNAGASPSAWVSGGLALVVMVGMVVVPIAASCTGAPENHISAVSSAALATAPATRPISDEQAVSSFLEMLKQKMPADYTMAEPVKGKVRWWYWKPSEWTGVYLHLLPKKLVGVDHKPHGDDLFVWVLDKGYTGEPLPRSEWNGQPGTAPLEFATWHGRRVLIHGSGAGSTWKTFEMDLKAALDTVPAPEAATRPATTAAASAPASETASIGPSKLASERAEGLKRDIKNFRLLLVYYGERDEPSSYRSLVLNVPPLSSRAKYPDGQITEAQAQKIIDYLATEGFLDRAEPPGGPLNVFPTPPAPAYRLAVPGFAENLGWSLPMLQRLDGLRTVLEGGAAKSMDLLLETLAGQREEWKKQAATGAGTQPATPRRKLLEDNLASLEFDFIGAGKLSNKDSPARLLLTRRDISGERGKWPWNLDAQLTEKEAARLVAAMADAGWLDAAKPFNAGNLGPETYPGYFVLFGVLVNHERQSFTLDLGWGPAFCEKVRPFDQALSENTKARAAWDSLLTQQKTAVFKPLNLHRLNLSFIQSEPPSKLPDLFETVPPNPSYELRAEVRVIEDGSDGTYYYVPSKDAFYLLYHSGGTAQFNYYGPIVSLATLEELRALIPPATAPATLPATTPEAATLRASLTVDDMLKKITGPQEILMNMPADYSEVHCRLNSVTGEGGYTPKKADEPKLLAAMNDAAGDEVIRLCAASFLLQLDNEAARKFVGDMLVTKGPPFNATAEMLSAANISDPAAALIPDIGPGRTWSNQEAIFALQWHNYIRDIWVPAGLCRKLLTSNEKGALPAVLALVNTNADYSIFEALIPVRDPKVTKVLSAILEKDGKLNILPALVLTRQKSEGIAKVLLRHLGEDAATEFLTELADPATVTPMQTYAQAHPDDIALRRAIVLISTKDPAARIKALVALAKQIKDPFQREAFWERLARDEKAREAVAPIRERMITDNLPSHDGIWALQAIATPEAIATLVDMLDLKYDSRDIGKGQVETQADWIRLITSALAQATGQGFGNDPAKWKAWHRTQPANLSSPGKPPGK